MYLQGTDGNEGDRVIVKADANLYFPGVELFRETLTELLASEDDNPTITLDFDRLTEMDYTALRVIRYPINLLNSLINTFISIIIWLIQMFKCVAAECHKRETILHFANITPKVARSLANMMPSSNIAFDSKVTSF